VIGFAGDTGADEQWPGIGELIAEFDGEFSAWGQNSRATSELWRFGRLLARWPGISGAAVVPANSFG
jgi:hypothetical protein